MVDLKIAPVALFVYNRPEHTRRTLESLRRNPEAAATDLFIFADGVRPHATQTERGAVERVRKMIDEFDWPGQKIFTKNNENRGLAKSIVTGVSKTVEQYGSVIVLEDDLETAPTFLEFMNTALRTFKAEADVYQISGFMYPHNRRLQPTGFLRATTSWGWATWHRAWRHYEADAEKLLERIRALDPDAFNLDGYSFHLEELSRNASGDLETWAVRWYASVFLRNGLCLYPHRSLVRNIGFDDSGENCDATSASLYRVGSFPGSIDVSYRTPQEDPDYLDVAQTHFQKLLRLWTRPSLKERILARLRPRR